MELQPWFWWALAIVVGFPLASAALGQALGAHEPGRADATRSIRHALNLLLPVAAFFLIFRYVAGGASESLGIRLLLTAALVLAIYVAVSVFNAVFFGRASGDSWRARTPKLLRDIILVLFVAVGFAIVLSQVWDQDITALLTALGVGSVILGFALQETLGNVMLGLSLLLERPFSEGDEIAIGDHEGIVEEINWRAIRVEEDGNIIIVPHAVAAAETIVNLSRPRPLVPVSVEIGFAYEHPPNRVRAMLVEALGATDGATLDDDKPELGVFVSEFGDSAIVYTSTFLVTDASVKERVIDRYMTLVWYAAQRGGFTIPFPIRTLYNFDGPGSEPDAGAEARTNLRASGFLAGALDPESLDEWAAGGSLRQYARGETVLRQGERAAVLSIIVSGSATVRTRTPDGRESELYELGHGDFFGETTLLSGAESPYSVVTATDVQALTVPAEKLRAVVEAKPSLAMEIGRVMDARRKAVRAIGTR